MMTLKTSITFLLLLCSFHITVVAQVKDEKEERIALIDFPPKAQEVINALPSKCKRLRFYKETDGLKKSFEAKFKHNSKKYSLEFSVDGNIEDIEVNTKLKDIDKVSKAKLKSYFNDSFIRHKFIKIQKQYVYQPPTNNAIFIRNVLSNHAELNYNYEIIVEVKTHNKREIKEFTFAQNIELLGFRILNPTSYEHVLY